MIAIAFAGMYLEALLFIEGTRRLGRTIYLSLPEREYEERLKRITAVEPELVRRCGEFRLARNDLIHEKAAESLEGEVLRFAQKEAVQAIELIRDVTLALGRPWPDGESASMSRSGEPESPAT